MKQFFGMLCGVAAVALMLFPTGKDLQPPTPKPDVVLNSTVNEAFDTYKRLWIELNEKAATKLDGKEFTTEQQVHEFLSSGQEPVRRIAFDKIAKHEQEVLGDGKWSPELHSQVLKGYSK